MGVQRIRDCNLPMLGKWCWRLLVDKDCLWFRVLFARYGVEEGRVKEGGCEASVWWRDLSALRSEEWFQGNVSMFVGDGKNTLFWSDVWVGGMSFRDLFNRLYELLVLKSESVFNMHSLGWGIEGGLGVGGVDCSPGKRNCSVVYWRVWGGGNIVTPIVKLFYFWLCLVSYP